MLYQPGKSRIPPSRNSRTSQFFPWTETETRSHPRMRYFFDIGPPTPLSGPSKNPRLWWRLLWSCPRNVAEDLDLLLPFYIAWAVTNDRFFHTSFIAISKRAWNKADNCAYPNKNMNVHFFSCCTIFLCSFVFSG